MFWDSFGDLTMTARIVVLLTGVIFLALAANALAAILMPLIPWLIGIIVVLVLVRFVWEAWV